MSLYSWNVPVPYTPPSPVLPQNLPFRWRGLLPQAFRLHCCHLYCWHYRLSCQYLHLTFNIPMIQMYLHQKYLIIPYLQVPNLFPVFSSYLGIICQSNSYTLFNAIITASVAITIWFFLRSFFTILPSCSFILLLICLLFHYSNLMRFNIK